MRNRFERSVLLALVLVVGRSHLYTALKTLPTFKKKRVMKHVKQQSCAGERSRYYASGINVGASTVHPLLKPTSFVFELPIMYVFILFLSTNP